MRVGMATVSLLVALQACGMPRGRACTASLSQSNPLAASSASWTRDPFYKGFGGLLEIRHYAALNEGTLEGQGEVRTSYCSFTANLGTDPTQGFEIISAANCLKPEIVKTLTAHVFAGGGYISFPVTTSEMRQKDALLQKLGKDVPTKVRFKFLSTYMKHENLALRAYTALPENERTQACGNDGLSPVEPGGRCANPLNTGVLRIAPARDLSATHKRVLTQMAQSQKEIRDGSKVDSATRSSVTTWLSALQGLAAARQREGALKLALDLKRCSLPTEKSDLCANRAAVEKAARDVGLLDDSVNDDLDRITAGQELTSLPVLPRTYLAALDQQLREAHQIGTSLIQSLESQKSVLTLQSNFAISRPFSSRATAFLAVPTSHRHPVMEGIEIRPSRGILMADAKAKANPNFADSMCHQRGTVVAIDRVFPAFVVSPGRCEQAESSSLLPLPAYDESVATSGPSVREQSPKPVAGQPAARPAAATSPAQAPAAAAKSSTTPPKASPVDSTQVSRPPSPPSAASTTRGTATTAPVSSRPAPASVVPPRGEVTSTISTTETKTQARNETTQPAASEAVNYAASGRWQETPQPLPEAQGTDAAQEPPPPSNDDLRVTAMGTEGGC